MLDMGRIKPKGKKTLNKEQALYNFEKHLRLTKKYSEKNVNNSLYRAKRLIDHYGIALPPTDDDAMRLEKASIGKLKNTTVKQYILTLKELATSMGIELKIKPPKITKSEISYLSLPEARAVLAACDTLRDYAIMSTLIFSAVRNTECHQIRVQDIDFKAKLIHIKNRGAGIKTYEERDCVMTEQGEIALRNWVEHRQTLNLDNDYLFVTEHGEPFSGRERLNRIVKAITARAGIDKRITCHGMRHTSAMLMLRSGMPVTSVSAQLGHKSIKTTVDFYLHSRIEDVRADIKNFII